MTTWSYRWAFAWGWLQVREMLCDLLSTLTMIFVVDLPLWPSIQVRESRRKTPFACLKKCAGQWEHRRVYESMQWNSCLDLYAIKLENNHFNQNAILITL